MNVTQSTRRVVCYARVRTHAFVMWPRSALIATAIGLIALVLVNTVSGHHSQGPNVIFIDPARGTATSNNNMDSGSGMMTQMGGVIMIQQGSSKHQRHQRKHQSGPNVIVIMPKVTEPPATCALISDST